MPGPPPNPNARRRNARPEWRRLPAAGRPGDPPTWPLDEKPNASEKKVWGELWASPQAVAWEALGWTRVVARYARMLIWSESKQASAGLISEVRQLEDRLGLNPMSMKRLQWEITTDAEQDTPTDVVDLSDYRERLGG